MTDDLDRERARRLDPAPLPPSHMAGGASAFVGRVMTAPSAVGQFFAVNPTTVLGTEVAGGAGTLTTDTSTTVPVYLVGKTVPNVGDNLVCKFVDYRWIAERRGTSMPQGACTGMLVPTTPRYVYFSCPNGGFPSGNPGLAMTQGAPSIGLGPFPVYPVGGGFVNHHVTLSSQAWYTPVSTGLQGNGAMGSYQSTNGGLICLYFLGCHGYLMTVFLDTSNNPFVYNYDTTWSFPLTAAATTQNGLSYGANTNNPFQIGQATTTQSGNGPALTGQFGPIITGGTGTSVFSSSSIGVPIFSP